jgi:hypothetical protein
MVSWAAAVPCRYRASTGIQRWVGRVIAKNLKIF